MDTPHPDPRTPDIVLGTMNFGTRTSAAEAVALLDRFVALGGVWLDTADVYAVWADPQGRYGHSEQVIGAWLADDPERRRRIAVSTEVASAPTDAGPWPEHTAGLSAPAIRAAVSACLDRLGLEQVDLLWAHVDDRRTPLEETVAAFGELAADGRTRALGASNHASWRVERARQLAAALGVPPYAALQLRHSVLAPRPGTSPDDAHTLLEREAADFAAAERLPVWVYTPLLNGAFTRPDTPLPSAYDHPGTDRVMTALDTIGADLDATRNQVVLAWLLSGPMPCSPIVGVSETGQLEEVMAARHLSLTPEHVELIDRAR